MRWILLAIVGPVMAQEPGHLVNPAPPKNAPPPKERDNLPVMTSAFAKARGLKGDEIRNMHYNRVSCSRRMFTASGRSIEGDGDLKVTRMASDFYEIEFPSHITFSMFGAYNPFQNGVADIETATSRQLVNMEKWSDGQSLLLTSLATIYPASDKEDVRDVTVVSEIKTVDGSAPRTYIVRQTFFTEQKFSIYYLCD